MHESLEIKVLLEAMQSPALPGIDLGLKRVLQLLDLLGNPQLRLPPVIHVAGTNGKGSLIAYLQAIFEAGGYKVHRYISPHLVRFHERIVLESKEISDDALLDVLSRVHKVMREVPATFFEATTAAAFLAFAETPADILLLETGLGGRLDATNVVPEPLLTAITPISLDHCEFLGSTLEAIAGEKAGIMKAGVPCVVGPQAPESLVAIEYRAAMLNAPLWRYGKEWNVVLQDGKYYYKSNDLLIALEPGLPGAHQYTNAATAVACVDILSLRAAGEAIQRPAAGLPRFARSDEIESAIQNACWPARLQRLDNHPFAKQLPVGVNLWLDGGHNPDAGKALAVWAKEQDKPLYLICGMVKGKDTEQFLRRLSPFIEKLYAISIPDEVHSQSANDIRIAANAAGIDVRCANSLPEALADINNCQLGYANVLICGSLYLAGWVLGQ